MKRHFEFFGDARGISEMRLYPGADVNAFPYVKWRAHVIFKNVNTRRFRQPLDYLLIHVWRERPRFKLKCTIRFKSRFALFGNRNTRELIHCERVIVGTMTILCADIVSTNDLFEAMTAMLGKESS